MVAVIGFLVFALALAAALGVIGLMVAPQWRRIASLAAGNVEADFQPLATLARAERRISRRRGGTAPSGQAPLRAAA